MSPLNQYSLEEIVKSGAVQFAFFKCPFISEVSECELLCYLLFSTARILALPRPFPSSDAVIGKEEADCSGFLDLYRKGLARKVWGLDLE